MYSLLKKKKEEEDMSRIERIECKNLEELKQVAATLKKRGVEFRRENITLYAKISWK